MLRFHQTAVLRTAFQGVRGRQEPVGILSEMSSFHSQYRAVGNNYNQTVKELRVHFSEKKAMALLYKLEKCTQELVRITQEIIRLTQEFERKWSQR